MITLRQDQEDVRTKLRVALRTSSSVLVFAPTGFGKTVLASALIKLILSAGKRVIFAVHRLALIKQTAVTLDAFGIPYTYIAAGMPHNPYAKVFIASIDTLKNRLGKYPVDYIFIDEAHLGASEGWSAVVAHYKSTKTKIIGLSGSPERLDGKPLGDVFDNLVMGPSVSWLIEQGFLSKYRAFSPKGIDLTGIRKEGNEFNKSDLDSLLSGSFILGNAVNHWRNLALGKRTIAFAHSVAKARELADQFTSMGYPFVALDANTPQAERDRAFNALADRQIHGITNCNLFAEGFDMSAQVGRDVPIECVLDLYPTNSLARHLQKHGRGLRRKPEPAILLDLVGGFAKLGLPDEEREWSLEGRIKRTREGDDAEEKVRHCTNCLCSHAPAPKCPHCGHVYPIAERTIEEVDTELEEIDVEAVKKARKVEQQRARSLDDLIKLGTARGYKSPEKWAAHVYTARSQGRTI